MKKKKLELKSTLDSLVIENVAIESERNFALLFETLPEKITNASNDGKSFYYNKSWTDYTGASQIDLVSIGWSNWIHADDQVEAGLRWANSVKTHCNFDMELRIRNKIGKYRWHNSKARFINDVENLTNQWYSYNTDIHEQKIIKVNLDDEIFQKTNELQVANELLIRKNKEIAYSKNSQLLEYSRSLIEASLNPLLTISTSGQITDLNQATIDAIGKPREDLIGTDFFNYFTEPIKARNMYKQVFKSGFVVNYPLTIKDHKLTDVLFNGSVYKDSSLKIVGAVVVGHDITLQNIFEKELKEAKIFAEFSTEIAEEANLKAQKAMLLAEEAVKAKQQFLSNMSHEIRTPMNAIIGFTKVLLRTDLSTKQNEYLTAIKLSGDALIVLINDILDLAKVDAGKMVFEEAPFKLSLSIAAMLHLFETKIQEKNLILVKKYDKNIPEVLLGDAVRLHQIIINLVSNAVKFTSEGKITVSVWMIEEDDEKVTIEFSISDTGIGIKDDKMSSIFENFQQATTDTSRLYGGTGLGLAIVKQLVESQGGTINVESKLGGGSKFSFVLDFQKTHALTLLEPEILEINKKIKDIKVLVVEDMALNQLLMKTLLDDFGFECDFSGNGKLAIEKLASETTRNNGMAPYNIILMDLQMPEMNGFEATEYIRKEMKSDIPIIALTADVTTVDLEKCVAIGMNDYLAKPVDERQLYTKIVNLIKKPLNVVNNLNEKPEAESSKSKCIDLSYLLQRTKSNPKLMAEMISIYLEQTPPLLMAMKESLQSKDWKLLQSAVHKMIPSFAIMGMNTSFEDMAKKIHEYAVAQHLNESIEELVLQLEAICNQACNELAEELNNYKK